MILVIVPHKAGHFLSYINCLKADDSDEEIIVYELQKIGFFKLPKLIFDLIRKPGVDQYIFLHGEYHIFEALLLALFSGTRRVKVILYYVFPKPNNWRKTFELHLVWISSLLGLKIYSLEHNGAGVSRYLQKNITTLFDPVLTSVLPYKEQGLQQKKLKEDVKESELSILVAGYLDDRKCIAELMGALAEYAKHNSETKIILTLMGQQSTSVVLMLESHLYNEIETVIVNRRFDDDELFDSISNCDLVSCLYKSHYGSSGMFINAIYCDKSVIFYPVGVLNNFSNELAISSLPTNNSSEELYLAISSLLNKLMSDENHRQYSLSDRDEFLAKRSTEQFRQSLIS